MTDEILLVRLADNSPSSSCVVITNPDAGLTMLYTVPGTVAELDVENELISIPESDANERI